MKERERRVLSKRRKVDSSTESSFSGSYFNNYDFKARDVLGNIFGNNNTQSGLTAQKVLSSFEKMIESDQTLEKETKDKFQNHLKKLSASVPQDTHKNEERSDDPQNQEAFWRTLAIIGLIGCAAQGIFLLYLLLSCQLPWLKQCQKTPIPVSKSTPTSTTSVRPLRGGSRQVIGQVIDRTETGKNGKPIKFSIVVISSEFAWKFQSSEKVEYQEKEIDFEKHLKSKGMEDELKRYKGGIIGVGTASSKGSEREELKRASDRANRLGLWIKESVPGGLPKIYTLTLGKHNNNAPDEATQRSIVLLGVEKPLTTGKLSDELDTIIKAMKNTYNDKNYSFPFNPNDYYPQPPELKIYH